MKFRILGIPVVVRPLFFAVIAMLGQDRLRQPALFLEFCAAAFIATLWHELGHAFAFRKFGRSPAIELHGMGGLTSAGGAPLGELQHAVASLCGPGFGLLLAGLVGAAVRMELFVPHSYLGYSLIHDLIWINVSWSIFNLLPVLPMDGGQVFRHALRSRWPERGEPAARWISLVFAAAGLLWALFHRQLWMAFLGLWFAGLNWRALQDEKEERACAAVISRLNANDLDAAWTEFKKIPPAKVHEHLLHPLAAELFSAGRFEQALQLEVVAFYRTKTADYAYNAACSMARLGRGPEALEWLGRAVDAGYNDRKRMENDPDLAGLHDQAGWQAVCGRAKGRSGPS